MIRYAYLWGDAHRRGQEEGLKDRPCAVILVTTNQEGEGIVTVLPVTHSPPADPSLAVELPPATKRRLALDNERSWVILGDFRELSYRNYRLDQDIPFREFRVSLQARLDVLHGRFGQ